MIKHSGAGRDVLWKLIDGIGLEHARLELDDSYLVISGTVLTTDGVEPVTIEYAVECDRYWHTREVMVQCRRASRSDMDTLHLTADVSGKWNRSIESDGLVTRQEVQSIDGCIDIDLGFSPVTNMLPIRRLELVVGASARVNAAWVQFPSMTITTLPQRYTRTGLHTYRYESFSPGFTATIEVDDLGLVRTYEDLWERVAEADLSLSQD